MKNHLNRYNNAEVVQTLISLYFHCERLIPDPLKNQHTGLLALLDSIENTKNSVKVKSGGFFSPKISDVSQSKWLSSKWQSNIKSMAEILLQRLSSEQHLVFITLLLRLMKVNSQQKNSELRTAIYLTADILNYNCEQTSKIERMLFLNEPNLLDYHSSIILQSKKNIEKSPNKQLKVMYLQDLSDHIWIQNIKPNNHLLFKIHPSQASLFQNTIENMELLTYNPKIKSLLKKYNLSKEHILSIIESPFIPAPLNEGSDPESTRLIA